MLLHPGYRTNIQKRDVGTMWSILGCVSLFFHSDFRFLLLFPFLSSSSFFSGNSQSNLYSQCHLRKNERVKGPWGTGGNWRLLKLFFSFESSPGGAEVERKGQFSYFKRGEQTTVPPFVDLGTGNGKRRETAEIALASPQFAAELARQKFFSPPKIAPRALSRIH